MITLKPVFYSKVGNHAETNRIIYKYYFGSITPHFYFVAYVVAKNNSYDIFFNPEANNIENTSVINIGEGMVNAKYDVPYGEDITLLLSNSTIKGYGNIISVKFSISEKPVAVNYDSVIQGDIKSAVDEAKEEVSPLVEIGLHTLSNTILIEVESKLNNIMLSSVGANQERIVPTIIRSILFNNRVFMNYIPKNLSSANKEIISKLAFRVFNVSPHTNNPVKLFVDTILFAKMIDEESISLPDIPYKILFRLMTKWIKTKHQETVILLKKAADNIEHIETISINMSTMEDVSKVYELLSKIQKFVYLKRIRFRNMESGETVDFSIDNEYYENYIKSTSNCIETKGISSSDGTITLQYGYGTSCDSFIGIFAVDNIGRKYGFRRDDKLMNNEYITARTWQWGSNKLIKTENEIDSSNNISVDFIGV